MAFIKFKKRVLPFALSLLLIAQSAMAYNTCQNFLFIMASVKNNSLDRAIGQEEFKTADRMLNVKAIVQSLVGDGMRFNNLERLPKAKELLLHFKDRFDDFIEFLQSMTPEQYNTLVRVYFDYIIFNEMISSRLTSRETQVWDMVTQYGLSSVQLIRKYSLQEERIRQFVEREGNLMKRDLGKLMGENSFSQAKSIFNGLVEQAIESEKFDNMPRNFRKVGIAIIVLILLAAALAAASSKLRSKS